jgi:hypothetical protein
MVIRFCAPISQVKNMNQIHRHNATKSGQSVPQKKSPGKAVSILQSKSAHLARNEPHFCSYFILSLSRGMGNKGEKKRELVTCTNKRFAMLRTRYFQETPLTNWSTVEYAQRNQVKIAGSPGGGSGKCTHRGCWRRSRPARRAAAGRTAAGTATSARSPAPPLRGTDQERETERPRGPRTRQGVAGGGERQREET